MDRLDIVTLAVPRPLVTGMLDKLFLHCTDLKQYKLRWIVGLDKVPLIEDIYSYEQSAADIMQVAAKHKLDLLLLRTNTNIGHAANFRRAIEPVAGELLYIEDDKYAQQDFTIDALRKSKADQVGIEGAHRLGHTWAYYGSKKYMDALKQLWPKDFVPAGYTAEAWVMQQWGKHPKGLRAAKRKGLVLDIGKAYRDVNGFIKQPTADRNSFTYAKRQT